MAGVERREPLSPPARCDSRAQADTQLGHQWLCLEAGKHDPFSGEQHRRVVEVRADAWSTQGCCTLTATTGPSWVSARRTCPIEAAAMGSSHEAKARSGG